MNCTHNNVKERILEVSIRLFLQKGFEGTTTKEIIDAAGIAKGTLYWHFKSKANILEEILDKFSMEMYDQAFAVTNACKGTFFDKFKTMYKFITLFARDRRELTLVISTILGEIAGSGSLAEQKLKNMQMRLHSFIKSLLDNAQKEGSIMKDIDTHTQAHIIIANFTGMHLQWCFHSDSLDSVVYTRAYFEAILRGLGVYTEFKQRKDTV